ncbi:MAG: ATP-binding cassette domain-containing protein [Clostridia bacterium]|nr:ATP-binding cassette domain-containing protein [Clostridia bacterium]
MEIIQVNNLSFAYPGGADVLRGVSFNVGRGEFVTLCGRSGCGKSTLLRHLKRALTPAGERSGSIFIGGSPIEALDERSAAADIGYVMQSPENQIVCDKVWHELAFGLESLGCQTPEIRARVAEMASYFGISDWFHRDTASLSGGQKQLLNLAAIMVMRPSILLLDEPTSQLDPIAAADFIATVGKINRELGTTVILAEHRLEEAFAVSDRVLVMDGGRIAADGTPRQAGEILRAHDRGMFAAMPTAMRVWDAVGGGECPVTVREGREWLSARLAKSPAEPLPTKSEPAFGEVVLSAHELCYRYEQNLPDVVRGLSLTLHRNEILAILGGNGSGKSTTLSLLCGLAKPQRGEIERQGNIALLPQDPQLLFTRKTVREELEGDAESAARVTSLCRLEGLLERHPYDLSGGELQRAALAKLLLADPDILLLDEPTKGLDAEYKQTFAAILCRLASEGKAILLVSHDVEFCASHAHRCALFFDGGLVSEGSPRQFFAANSFYTTSAARIARGLIDKPVTTADDLAAVCGGSLPPIPEPVEIAPPPVPPPKKAESAQKKQPRAWYTWAAMGVLLALIVPTILLGTRFFGARRYYFTALLVLIETLAAFAVSFEGRRPSSRELTMLASLCALGIAGRAVFFMLPECKPIVAIVVVAGAALGGESGFLVGAMTMLASNMLFGQGPWTPWQMLAMGLCGLAAGLFLRRIRPTRLTLCAAGGIAAVVIYGGVMNLASAMMWSGQLNAGAIGSYFVSGLPMDLVRGVSTAVFLWFGGMPLYEKLARMKLKM